MLGKDENDLRAAAVLANTLSFQTTLFYVTNVKLADYFIININNQHANCL